MLTRLLNLGFCKKPNGTLVCEDIVVEIHGDKVYVIHLQMELTIDELEDLMLADWSDSSPGHLGEEHEYKNN